MSNYKNAAIGGLNNNNPKLIMLIVWVAMVAAIIIGASSCNTVKKSLNKEQVKTDSVSVKKSDEIAVTRHDSSINGEANTNYTKETIYHYDTILIRDTVTGKDVVKYVPRIVTVYEQGQTRNIYNATYFNYDSARKVISDSLNLKKEVKTVVKEKESSRTSWLMWLFIALAIIGAVFVYVRFKK